MVKRGLRRRDKYLIIFGMFLVLGFAAAYNSGGPPPVFGHSAGEIEDIESLSVNYLMNGGVMIPTSEIILEENYDSSSGPQGPFYGLIDVGSNPNIPSWAKEVLVYVTADITEESFSNIASWKIEMNNEGIVWRDLIVLDEKWDNLHGDFLVKLPLNSSQMMAFRASGSPGKAYVKVEVQGYSA